MSTGTLSIRNVLIFGLFLVFLFVILKKITLADNVSSMQVINASKLISSWTKGSDHPFEKVSKNGRFVIEKAYLNSSWEARFPNKTSLQTFYVNDISSQSRIKLFENSSKEKISFHDISVLGNDIFILSSLDNKDIFIYSYNLNSKEKTIKKVKIDSSETIKKAIFFNKSIYIVTDSGFRDNLIKYNLSGEKTNIIKTGDSSSIYDIAVINNKLLVISSDRLNKKSSNFIVINELDYKDDKFSKDNSFIFKSLALQQKLLIKDALKGGEYLLYSETYAFLKRKTTTAIYKISQNKKLSRVYKKTEVFNRKSDFLGVCNNKLLFGKNEKINKKYRLILSLNGLGTNKPQNKYIVNDYDRLIISLDAVTRTKNKILYVNYSKFEEKRRSDGWYSWYGYDALDIGSICK
jgi:hypothetical protein